MDPIRQQPHRGQERAAPTDEEGHAQPEQVPEDPTGHGAQRGRGAAQELRS